MISLVESTGITSLQCTGISMVQRCYNISTMYQNKINLSVFYIATIYCISLKHASSIIVLIDFLMQVQCVTELICINWKKNL